MTSNRMSNGFLIIMHRLVVVQINGRDTCAVFIHLYVYEILVLQLSLFAFLSLHFPHNIEATVAVAAARAALMSATGTTRRSRW